MPSLQSYYQYTPQAHITHTPHRLLLHSNKPLRRQHESRKYVAYFVTRWQDYVEATKIEGKDLVIQLLECCDEQFRKDLTRNAGGSLTNETADEVLAAIKKLAVRVENTMVARVQLHNMRQDNDETIRSFGARVRGQAGVFKYQIKCQNCDTEVSYTEQIIRDVITRGFADSEIQLDLTGRQKSRHVIRGRSQICGS